MSQASPITAARSPTSRSRRTRVLVQLHSLELGGTQINALDLALAVRELGFDSILVGPRDALPAGPSILDLAAERGVKIEMIRRHSTVRDARHLHRLAVQHAVDLVHAYGPWSARPAYWGPSFLGRRPLVMTLYEMAVAPDTFRAADLIIGTRYLLEDLAGRHGGVHLISPPVDLTRDDMTVVSGEELVRSEALDPSRVRIVIVSRLDDEMKAFTVETALRAMNGFSQDAELVIVGTGPAEARLRALGAETNARLGRRAVVFTGAVADPRPAYASADIVIGMGGSAARGLAFGKPLVVSGEFGWFRTFRPDTAAALFRNSFWSDEASENPVGELVREIRPLLSDRSERETLGRFGRQFAEANFGLSAMAGRLAAVYERALARYGAGAWLFDLPLEIARARDRWVRRWPRRPRQA